MPQPTIHVIIKDKNGVMADDNATALSSYNEVGLFDVLPLHTNFISLIRDKLILHKVGGDREIKVQTGLLQVKNGEVYVYLGLPQTAQTMENLNAARPLQINARKVRTTQSVVSQSTT